MMPHVRAALLSGLLIGAPAQLGMANDLPPTGRSLFDHVTSRTIDGRSVQRIPYPFAALLDELRHHAGVDTLGRPGLAAVLIPLGRSLQRNASAGDYFRHPRVVVAITGEARTQGPPRLLLKDRLFLGFQDEAGVIEVISYNEHAARFEFQVVTDYRENASPRVAYARRAVCSACHHAGAPIFSRPGWDETNANPAVARALSAHAASFHGVTVKRGVDVPNAIDDSVARANRIAIAQTLWGRGCDAVVAPSEPVACREALLLGVLQRRLQSPPGSNVAPADTRLAALASAWRTLWPQGIAEPDPNIPNRDPFFGQAQQFAQTGPGAPWGAEEVLPALDPMASRPPVDMWRADAGGLEALLHALGTFFAGADVQALSHVLTIARAGARPMRERHRGSETHRGEPAPQPGASSEQILARAVAAVGDETRAGRSDALGSASFRRATLLRALFGALGTKATLDCCDEPAPALTLAVLEAGHAAAPATIPGRLQPFYAHCAACHAMPTASPPGFLYGNLEAVERHLARCAPRIRFRLSMWQTAPAARAKTPMPPPVFVPAWEHAAPRAAIERMLDYATRALPAGATPGLPAGGYEALPQCRQPDAEAHAPSPPTPLPKGEGSVVR